MNAITLDESLRAKLNGLNTIVTVRDEAGHDVGQFLPQDLFETLFEAWANSEVTDEELETASKAYPEMGGLPTKEAIDYIRRVVGEVG